MANSLLQVLNTTGLAKDNPQLYQLLAQLIISEPTPVVNPKQISLIEIDTSLVAVSIPLITSVKNNQFMIYKDISGNALINNITLVGTVDGVVDPVINTNYGILRIVSTKYGYMQW